MPRELAKPHCRFLRLVHAAECTSREELRRCCARYFDGSLSDDGCRDIEKHLWRCPRCEALWDRFVIEEIGEPRINGRMKEYRPRATGSGDAEVCLIGYRPGRRVGVLRRHAG